MEGRRSTDFILAMCSTSFIISSGIAKDVGLQVMEGWGVHVFWMPAVVGFVFTPLLLVGVFMLHQIPDPSVKEIKNRSIRSTMGAKERMAFVIEIWPGLLCILIAFFLTSSYRDYRDMFMVEILSELDTVIEPGMMSQSELLVGFVIGIFAACIVIFKSNRWGFLANSATMTLGFLIIGVVALSVDSLSAFVFLAISGVGVNLIFVPMEAGYFERLIAFLRMEGASASFPVQITGSEYRF